jgi:3-phosphoshikimate 1-carboxyvinyltransferase
VKEPLPDRLAITPFARPLRGSASVPGSKSLTNRAMLLSALADGPVTLTGALLSEDTEIMADCLRRLGFAVAVDETARTVSVEGLGGAVPAREAELFVGLAGTAARFLTALCAGAREGTFRLDGVPQMRRRPMRGLILALRSLGADIRCLGEEGFLPVEARAGGLRGGTVAIDASESSQMLSALLMVAPLADSPVRVSRSGPVREPFVRMTRLQMAQFGISPGESELAVPVGRYRSPGRYAVEPDASAASYFAALPLVAGGSLLLEGLLPASRSLQGDVRFLDVLRDLGAVVAEGPGGITVSRGAGSPRAAAPRDFSEFSDTFLTLAAIAPLLSGPTRITGIAHTRRQETDRVSGAAEELRRLGQEVVETEDSIEIRPGPLRAGVTIDTRGDHRFAMSFAVLGCHDLRGDGSPWLTIGDPACCAKTFPGFFSVLGSLRKQSLG